jgi:N-carbamoyl-L-amino-acid hydrolase
MSGNGDRLREDFEACFGGLAAIGRDPAGGWTRLAWTDEDRVARSWFESEATARGLTVDRDPAGNLWAWWPGPATDQGGVVAVGSHLDTVRGGGAYDGALGVVSGLVAVGQLIAREVEPERPVAVVAFVDEEGGRFGVPTFGSRVLAGALDPPDVLGRTDQDGVTVAEAMAAAGVDPETLGADQARVGRLGAFVELHVEQGRALIDLGQPVGLGTGIWPHGRWRLTLTGEANHAGTTRLADRLDPMLGFSAAVLA